MLFYNKYMTYNQIFQILSQHNVPLADIKVIFDGYFHVDFDRLGILGDKRGPDDINDLLEKLDQGYPVAYLVGYTDILGLHLFLNEDTLIPRIETEDFVYSYLKYNYDFNHKKVLDLCTGSDFIALAIKNIYPDAEVYASDIVDNVLSIARKNADYNHLDVTFLKSDFLKDIHGTFDVIVSNPPYIEEDSKDVDAPFEPALALFSGKDGLDSYRSIFSDLDSHLNEEGLSFFELESTNSQATLELMNLKNPGYEARIIQDLYQRDRYLEAKKH